MFHMPVYYVFAQPNSPLRAPNADIAVLIVLVVAAVADKFVDRPIHKLFKKGSLQSKVGIDLIAGAPSDKTSQASEPDPRS